jgi:adenylate cyclase
VRIAAQLIDVTSQAHLWSEVYDRALKDVFAIQSDIAKQVADALQITLLADEQTKVERRHTTDIEAHNSYLKGLYFFNQGGDALEKSRMHFEQAIEQIQTTRSRVLGCGLVHENAIPEQHACRECLR